MTSPGLSIAAATVALMLCLPFVLPLNTLPVPTFYQEWGAAALGCAAFIALLLPRTAGLIEIPRITLLPIIVLVLLLIQIAQGRLVYWQQGAMAAMYLLWSIAMMCVGRTLRSRLGWENFCATGAWAVLFGALAATVLGLAQLAGSDLGGLVVSMIGPRVHANLGQSNHFAAYLSLGLLSAMYLAALGRMPWHATAGLITLILALANFSGSRSVWLYLFSALILGVWTYLGARSRQSSTLLAWTVAGIAVLLAVQLISSSVLQDSALLQTSIGVRTLANDTGTSPRQVIWLASVLMFKSAVYSGVGFGGFGSNYFLSANQLPEGVPEEITDNAHNLPLHLLAEFGLPGGIVLIGAGLIWGVSLCRKRATLQLWWLASLVAIMSLHSLLEYPLWYTYFLGPFALLLGAGDDSSWSVSLASASRLMVAGLCLVVVWTLASVFYDYRAVQRLGGSVGAGKNGEQLRDESIRVAGSSLFVSFLELGLSRTIVVNQHNLDAKLELNGRVLQAYPTADVAFRQSALHALAGDLASAYREWNHAVSAYPSEEAGQIEALELLASRGETLLAPLVEYAASRTGEQ